MNHDWIIIPVHGAAPDEYKCRRCGQEWINNGVNPMPECVRVTAEVSMRVVVGQTGLSMDLIANFLDALESMARQHCATSRVDRDYNGQVAGSLVTDSGAISANAEALELLANHKRFHVIRSGGRMVVGYWPENLPAIYQDPPKSGPS